MKSHIQHYDRRTPIYLRFRSAQKRRTSTDAARLALAKLLLEEGDRHVTAEQLHCEAADAGIKVSLATVYNSLHQFTKAKLLREVVVESGRAYFDTNTDAHYHIFHQDTGELCDIPDNAVSTLALPDLPAGTEIDRVDVIVRVKTKIQ